MLRLALPTLAGFTDWTSVAGLDGLVNSAAAWGDDDGDVWTDLSTSGADATLHRNVGDAWARVPDALLAAAALAAGRRRRG